MDKGGGGYDTSAMEAATNRGIDLQEKMYEEGKDLSKPWYNAGSSAVSRLSDLLGLAGGGSVKTQQQLFDQLKPQYTTAATSTPGTPAVAAENYRGNPFDWRSIASAAKAKEASQPVTTPESVDYDALNAAVASQLSQQQTPEDFGTLGKAFSMEDYQEDPGYKFRLEQGQQGLDRSLAARGKTFSGEAAKAAVDYNSGMASQEYGNAYNRYNTDQNNLYNMLAGVSGFGQNAANSQVQQGQAYTQGVNDLTTGLANAQTSAQVAEASRPSLFSQLLGAGAQIGAATYGGGGWSFSDERLKENIREIDEIDGVKRYEFSYKDEPQTRYIGAMAQQVLDVIPEAVHIGDDGYYMVDYSMLPFQMSEALNAA